jgi:hypothetical protein
MTAYGTTPPCGRRPGDDARVAPPLRPRLRETAEKAGSGASRPTESFTFSGRRE